MTISFGLNHWCKSLYTNAAAADDNDDDDDNNNNNNLYVLRN